MSRKVLYSKAAIGDLDGIAEWVAGETGDTDGARRVVRRIVERVGLPGDFPEMGRELRRRLGRAWATVTWWSVRGECSTAWAGT